MRKLIIALLVATVLIFFSGVLLTQAPQVNEQEATGRVIVMVARGWSEWPTEPALPSCEWDKTGSYHLITPCEAEGGMVYYRNGWPSKRWAPTQRKEM